MFGSILTDTTFCGIVSFGVWQQLECLIQRQITIEGNRIKNQNSKRRNSHGNPKKVFDHQLKRHQESPRREQRPGDPAKRQSPVNRRSACGRPPCAPALRKAALRTSMRVLAAQEKHEKERTAQELSGQAGRFLAGVTRGRAHPLKCSKERRPTGRLYLPHFAADKIRNSLPGHRPQTLPFAI